MVYSLVPFNCSTVLQLLFNCFARTGTELLLYLFVKKQ